MLVRLQSALFALLSASALVSSVAADEDVNALFERAAGVVTTTSSGSSKNGPPIRKIVNFGDSLTDSGAALKLTTGNGPAIPSDAYYKGRFSNGPTFIEEVARLGNGIPLDNRAVGGATTSDKLVQGWLGGKFGEPLRSNGKVQNVPGVDTQVAAYLKSNGDKDKNCVLYTIFACGNDYFDDLLLNRNQPGGVYAGAQPALWHQLVAAGAQNIMVVIPMAAGPFFVDYGNQLKKDAAAFTAKNKNVRLQLAPLDTIVADIQTNAAKYGFTNANSTAPCCLSCTNGLPKSGGNATICAQPDTYLTWDGVHPTAAQHRLWGQKVYDFAAKTWSFKK